MSRSKTHLNDDPAPFTGNINALRRAVGESGAREVRAVQMSDVNPASANPKRFLRLQVLP